LPDASVKDSKNCAALWLLNFSVIIAVISLSYNSFFYLYDLSMVFWIIRVIILLND
jgi:hypothetical protein